ncbi:MAG: hypothetical protein JJT76_12990 [Clostridiaceae bacterium]|nr:hypothetical protein [Clostridiaceae bacterium]
MEEILMNVEAAAQKKRLEDKLKIQINSLVEGLETKESVIREIKDYIAEEYIGKGALKLLMSQLEGKGNVDSPKRR